MSTKNRPSHEEKIGRIKATVWKNDTDRGDRFNTQFSRLYRVAPEERKKGDSGWRETNSFGRNDLLVLAKLADRVHTWICDQNGGSHEDDTHEADGN